MSIANMNLAPSDQCAVVGVIDPDAYTDAAYTSDWVAIKDFEAFMGIVTLGDMVATSTCNAVIQQATDSGGSGATGLTPAKAITALTAVGSDDNKQAILNVRREEFSAGYTHCALVVTIGTAGADMAGVLLGFYPRNDKASDSDLASVDEVVI